MDKKISMYWVNWMGGRCIVGEIVDNKDIVLINPRAYMQDAKQMYMVQLPGEPNEIPMPDDYMYDIGEGELYDLYIKATSKIIQPSVHLVN